jgi:hypothetical protein
VISRYALPQVHARAWLADTSFWIIVACRRRPSERIDRFALQRKSRAPTLLGQNPHLLPSEQIYAEAPPRSAADQGEIRMTDSASGSVRWSVDILVRRSHGDAHPRGLQVVR